MPRPLEPPRAVMIFAAGFGTRMGALTADRPKPLIEVAGETLLDHALSLTGHLDRRVVNTHYRADQIARHLAARPPDAPQVAISHETPHILDTGGGLRQALPQLGPGPVFTLNADAVWTGPNPLRALAAGWAPERMQALLLCVPPARAAGRQGGGDFSLDARGRLVRGGPVVYTGAQILQTERLGDVAEDAFSLNRIWDMMAAEGGLYGLVYDGHWADVGHPAGIAAAEAMRAASRDPRGSGAAPNAGQIP